ncbi:MAG: formylglycine-generating enzyme family protein [Kiritimatiellae bacterium]|nr:formylglycine-generating enzyme family protein [Kiritimatiellia bacterium]
MKTVKSLAALTCGIAFLQSVNAIPCVEIDKVAQRWPWNNKVDITYTITDGQDLANGTYYRLVFTIKINGQVHTIDGTTDVGASANTGTHTVTWTAPAGIKATTFTTSASIYTHDAPSGDDYMVVDLDSRTCTYEGLLATQEASNQRYNTALYKTDKVVLRKVAAGGTYPTGDDANYSSANSARTWTTDRDYYIGIFMITQAQYQKIMGKNPSGNTKEIEGDIVEHRPVEQVAWITLRGMSNAKPRDPVVANASGGFFPRFNALTGLNFDFPTEVMFEIAARAGVTTAYSWGDSIDYDYIVYYGNAQGSSRAVGSMKPNDWGLYDTSGNMWEYTLDGYIPAGEGTEPASANMANKQDPWTPSIGNGVRVWARGGASWEEGESTKNHHRLCMISYRNGIHGGVSGSKSIGFRVALVKEP